MHNRNEDGQQGSILRRFWVGLPKACGVSEGIAEIEGERLGKLFDHEIANPKSVYARQVAQTVAQRLEPAFAGWKHLADPHAVEFAEKLGVYTARSIDVNRGEVPPSNQLDAERISLAAQETLFPEIASLLTVEQASVLSNWA